MNCSKITAQLFLDEIKLKLPKEAHITSHSIEEVSFEDHPHFSINNSFESDEGKLFFPPDLAMCDSCGEEILDNKNNRFYYPFTTCTKCGPRFSILNSIPYDRESTKMDAFEMCDECKYEYVSIKDERFHSQTNSCPKCGVEISIYDGEKEEKVNNKEAIDFICEKINAENIIAVKGIGGYLLIADASNEKVIKKLRSRKNREKKPFAIICPDNNFINKIAFANNKELEAINSKEAEIVLLKVKKEINEHISFNEIAPNLNKVGVMKPYAPILKLIVNQLGKAIIATSGNISGSPIIYKNDIAKEQLINIADYIVLNNREIVLPQDDSVSQFTNKKRKITLRRSRGLAPNFFSKDIDYDQDILSTGALMKSSFAFYHKKQFYISQYLGNTEYLESQNAYIDSYKHIKSVLKTKSDKIICDSHPNYFSSNLANELSTKHKTNLIEVQHHEAHFSSVIGENNLYSENVLGFIWDGTGFGDDKNIWGGEVFELKNGNIARLFNLEYTKHVLLDKMSKEARISALSHFKNIEDARNNLKNKFSDIEWQLFNKKDEESNLFTSSMGRLFDAVSSILGICDINDYEGEAAILLETFASKYIGDYKLLKPYSINLSSNEILLRELKEEVIEDIKKGITKEEIAMKFHLSLVEIISKISEEKKIDKLAFSGGVFQNALLVELIEEKLSKTKKLYFHKQLSPNDENISHGQIIRHYLKEKIESKMSEVNIEYQ